MASALFTPYLAFSHNILFYKNIFFGTTLALYLLMKMTKVFALCIGALVLAGLSTTAEASKLHMVINGKSIHVNSNYGWNEKNYGAGIEYEFDTRSRWIRTTMANAFLDSGKNMSYMLGAGLHRRLIISDRFAGFYMDAGLNAFVMTREDVENNRPFPAILPSMTFGNRYGGINVSYVPKMAVRNVTHADRMDPGIGGIFFIQAKIRLDALFQK